MTSLFKESAETRVRVYVHMGEGCGDESMLEPGVGSREYAQTFSRGADVFVSFDTITLFFWPLSPLFSTQ